MANLYSEVVAVLQDAKASMTSLEIYQTIKDKRQKYLDKPGVIATLRRWWSEPSLAGIHNTLHKLEQYKYVEGVVLPGSDLRKKYWLTEQGKFVAEALLGKDT